ncbi:hypothetical protein GPZ74_32140 [Burkholderia pseudomallei]|nr:hypothetical protein [Burkholderia pseudomallei]MWA21991.1 hypothetical protein [Burkholderia pseudomallei]MWA28960.1 hypothetical protein [Burkholderia pseudomallei]
MRALAHDVSDDERRSALGALHVTQPRGRERAALGAAAARAARSRNRRGPAWQCFGAVRHDLLPGPPEPVAVQ